jgi:hypothetical protein
LASSSTADGAIIYKDDPSVLEYGGGSFSEASRSVRASQLRRRGALTKRVGGGAVAAGSRLVEK